MKLETGNRVCVTIIRGGSQNEDGIYRGGKSIMKLGTIKVSEYADGCYRGMVHFDDGDFQSVKAITGVQNFPAVSMEMVA